MRTVGVPRRWWTARRRFSGRMIPSKREGKTALSFVAGNADESELVEQIVGGANASWWAPAEN